MDYQKIIEQVWPDVRSRHLFPELPVPEMAEEDEAVSIQMAGKQIRLSKDVCETLSESMAPEEAVGALLDHGVAHHTVCPWDFETHLALYASLKPVLLDGDRVKQVVDYFMDVVVDTHCVRERDSKLPEVYRHSETDGVSRVIRALYQRIWGVDLGEDEGEEADHLSRIPYLDRKKWGEGIRTFARVVVPLLEEEEEGDGDPMGMDGGMMGDHSLQQYSAGEIEEALKEFSEQGFYAFRAMIEDFREELEEAGVLPEMGRGKGVPSDADMLFYMKRASRYVLPIQTVMMEKVGGLHPHSHSPWEIGRPVGEIDVWTSFGKVLPGISQVWNWEQGETHGKGEGIPDCVVMVDSSGSMVNPCEELSHAVLGAGCAADAYLMRRKRVAVYNFSDAPSGGREILDLTRNRQMIYRTLCRYFGGGTALHLPDFDSIIRKETDIFLITDMQITNLEAVVDYLLQARCRVTAVHVGRNRDVERFRKRVTDADNICVYAVDKPEDIPGIVLAEVEARFGE